VKSTGETVTLQRFLSLQLNENLYWTAWLHVAIGLMCPQHRVAHNSADGGDSQPGDIWEIRKITGMRKVDGIEEFRVAWESTWMHEYELGGARELVEEFRARLSVRHGKNEQGETDAAGESLSKRRRGRPRKQV